MSGERRLRILAELTTAFTTRRLCEVCAEVTGVTGAGIMLMSGDVPRGSVCSTDEVSALIEELQYSLGEGPCVDAYRFDVPVLEPDLERPETQRWVAFSPAVVAAGARAVFGFPLQVGAVRLGALNLYRSAPGPLSDDQHHDALVVADIAAQSVLMWQADAPPGRLADELERGGDYKYVVHQAAGMVAAQLEVSVAHALIRLRAHAFANDLPLTDVAAAVVARSLRFTADDPDVGAGW
ncbi:MAG TPA: GAF and ANTAR domain-containing protein [Acidimicrobiia bacterium]|nr:GAF and ANTAR domain-containing protein [Acidimicrobiia bacterium]